MYIWTTTSVSSSSRMPASIPLFVCANGGLTLQPNRDGSLNNDIIVHEMTHGITNRLTGGGTARCLQSTESRGMGEGWSDAMAE